MISERQKNFCREYVKDFNATQAMIRAGYAASTADKKGFLMLREPGCCDYIKKLMDKTIAKQELSAEIVVEEFRRLAMSNISDYYKWCNKKKTYVPKQFDELTRDQTAAIAKYDPKEGYTLYNKDPALDKLGKFFKLYSEIPTLVQNYVMMPAVKINGVEHVFNVGKPKKSIS